jgi:hypothetical protein
MNQVPQKCHNLTRNCNPKKKRKCFKPEIVTLGKRVETLSRLRDFSYDAENKKQMTRNGQLLPLLVSVIKDDKGEALVKVIFL